MRHTTKISLGLLAIFTGGGVAASPGSVDEAARDSAVQSERAQMESVKRSEIAAISRLLTNTGTERHGGAIHQLIHLASSYPVLPPEVRILLIRATVVPDGQLASLAEEALYLFENREGKGTGEPEIADEVAIELSRRRELEHARWALEGGALDPGERIGALQLLVHLNFAAPALADEVRSLLEGLRADADPDIARMAGRALGRERETD